jgi:hypothetical protein
LQRFPFGLNSVLNFGARRSRRFTVSNESGLKFSSASPFWTLKRAEARAPPANQDTLASSHLRAFALERFHFRCSADIPVGGFTGLSSPVFSSSGNRRLESRLTRRLESLRYMFSVNALNSVLAGELFLLQNDGDPVAGRAENRRLPCRLWLQLAANQCVARNSDPC